MFGKRGLSSLIVSVLFVLLVFASVVIVWAAVRGVVDTSGDIRSSGLLLASPSVKPGSVYIDEDGDRLQAVIQRGSDNVGISAIRVVITDKSGENLVYTIEDFPEPLGSKSYHFNIEGLGEVSSVSVYPMLDEFVGGERRYGRKGSEPSSPPGGNWNPVVRAPDVGEGAPGCEDGSGSCNLGDTLSCDVGGYQGTRSCFGDCSGWGACDVGGFCGDGEINGPEECDDGGEGGGDGCSADCEIEAGWSCNGEPSTCSALSFLDCEDAGDYNSCLTACAGASENYVRQRLFEMYSGKLTDYTAGSDFARGASSFRGRNMIHEYQEDGDSAKLIEAEEIAADYDAAKDEDFDSRIGWSQDDAPWQPHYDCLPVESSYTENLHVTSNVILFLLELYEETGKQEYLDLAKDSVDDFIDNGDYWNPGGSCTGNNCWYFWFADVEDSGGNCQEDRPVKNLNVNMGAAIAKLYTIDGSTIYRDRAQEVLNAELYELGQGNYAYRGLGDAEDYNPEMIDNHVYVEMLNVWTLGEYLGQNVESEIIAAISEWKDCSNGWCSSNMCECTSFSVPQCSTSLRWSGDVSCGDHYSTATYCAFDGLNSGFNQACGETLVPYLCHRTQSPYMYETDGTAFALFNNLGI